MNIYITLFLSAVFISSIAQILLKKSALSKHERYWKEYLNIKVITAYCLFFLSSAIVVVSYRFIPFSTGVILDSSGYIFVSLLSYCILKEKISKRKIIGIALILVGIIIVSI